MNRTKTRYIIALTVLVLLPTLAGAEEYHCYFGNTHAHSTFSDGKGTPAEHFQLAKEAGYDFYAMTDHALAKYKGYKPENYETTKRAAGQATDSKFVALVGFEFSENDGPKGTGHLNVLNSASTLDATGPKVTLPVFYDWLATQGPTVAASFNHPAPATYNGFAYLTDKRREGITMYEMINSRALRYPGFLKALNEGWRVAPMAGQDNHSTWGIQNLAYRTGVLAQSLTRENIMEAMRARRVYCTWDKNLHLWFRANGRIMGSVLSNPASVSFSVWVSDPDTSEPKDRITRVELVGENGKLLRWKDFSAHTASWEITLPPTQKYYFLLVYCADKKDGPTAYSAPIWVERRPGK